MDFFNDIFHNLALLEFYFLNIIYILLYIEFILSIFFQHSNILTRASHHWCLASNIVLVLSCDIDQTLNSQRHIMLHPCGKAMECLLWVFWSKNDHVIKRFNFICFTYSELCHWLYNMWCNEEWIWNLGSEVNGTGGLSRVHCSFCLTSPWQALRLVSSINIFYFVEDCILSVIRNPILA